MTQGHKRSDADDAQVRNLAAVAADLLQRAAAAPAGRAALTLAAGPGAPLKQTMLALRNGEQLAERARKREALLAATEAELAKVARRVEAGRLLKAGVIGVRVGRVLGRYKMAKHFALDIADGRFDYTRDQAAIDAEAALDGIYVVRTSVGADRLDAPGVVGAYKRLANVERDFRSLKTIDLDLRPIRHWTEPRVRAHVLVCMLACYLTWHLRRVAGAAHLHRPDPTRPRRPRRPRPAVNGRAAQGRSSAAGRRQHHPLLPDPAGPPRHLARHQVTFTGPTHTTIDKLTVPTPTQRRAFELIGAPIPLTLT